MSDTSNLHIDYFTDSVTFGRRIIIGGADPSHSKDLRNLGGVFHCYLEGGKRGWVFGISMEPALENYIKTGKLAGGTKKATNILDMSKEGEKKDTGVCNICKKSVKLETAVKSYVCYYTGGLPAKITGELMSKDYRNKISVAFANGSFTCTDCLRVEAKAQTPPPELELEIDNEEEEDFDEDEEYFDEDEEDVEEEDEEDFDDDDEEEED